VATEKVSVVMPYGNQKPFDHHNVFPLPLTPIFFYPFFTFPPLMVTKTLLVAMLCDPFIKKIGLLMGTHWEFEWNMLGTNGKMEHNPSLLGAKFDTICNTYF
jgi:hypothetical protein